MAGLDLGAGDEILTSDQEHPGLIGPLLAARERGATIRIGPLARLAEAVEPTTTVIACSHVGWVDGQIADPSLGATGLPLILDGAQGAGADRRRRRGAGLRRVRGAPARSGCAAPTGPGCCTSRRSTTSASAPSRRRTSPSPRPTAGWTARCTTTPGATTPRRCRARASRSRWPRRTRLESYGWERVYAEGTGLAQRLVERLRETGRVVAPRGDTTLVSWEDPAPEETRERMADAGVILRNLPGTSYLRASVGAWNDESDLDRVLELL